MTGDRTSRIEQWIPPGIDTHRPCPARVVDALLDGRHHFPADRLAAVDVMRAWQDAAAAARAQRAFIRRAVNYLVRRGISQFLVVGGGLPSSGNVHEVARDADPTARVLYVEADPVTVAHARMILRQQQPLEPSAGVILADVRTPERILTAPDLPRFLDLTQPVAVVLADVLHTLPDEDDPAGIVAAFRDAVVPGSALVLSHPSIEALPDAEVEAVAAVYRQFLGPLVRRSRSQLWTWLDGWQVLDPGVVYLSNWHPDQATDTQNVAGHSGYAAVAVKPEPGSHPSEDLAELDLGGGSEPADGTTARTADSCRATQPGVAR